jgi:acetyl-CoA carboxylase carboxyl transferase subunit beta
LNWINNVVRPKIRGILRTSKPELPDNMWIKCPDTGQMVFHKELEDNLFVFPGSGAHMRMSATQRLEALFDGRAYDKVALNGVALDPLKFRDEKRYVDRLKGAKDATSLEDAVLVGEGRLDGRPIVAAVQDFRFMGGSLGMAAGEAVITGMLRAVEKRTPFILFAASGGARMQEGILSLMQMPRTTIAVQNLREARLPYIVVLTNPTTGGVTASYAMLGDVHIAEPGALIGFAGPRVIQQTIREQLPDGFQRAEYLLEHGMVDMVVHRHQLRDTLSRLCRILMSGQAQRRERRVEDRRPANGIYDYGHEHAGINGSAVDHALLESRAESGKALMIEAEPVDDSDRVDEARFLNGSGARRDGDGKTVRTQPPPAKPNPRS